MFARQIHVTTTKSPAASEVAEWHERWLAEIQHQPGYLGQVTISQGSSQRTTITLWRSKVDAEHWQAQPMYRELDREYHRFVDDQYIVEGDVVSVDFPLLLRIAENVPA